MCCDSSVHQSPLFVLLQLFDNIRSLVLVDEDEKSSFSQKTDQALQRKKWAYCMCGTALSVLLLCQSHLAWPCFSVEHQRLTITRLREPEKESKITLRS